MLIFCVVYTCKYKPFVRFVFMSIQVPILEMSFISRGISFMLKSKAIRSYNHHTRLSQCLLCTSQTFRHKSGTDPEGDEPIKYSTSRAQSWDSVSGFQPPKYIRDAPWYQPFVIFGSVAIFLIYFTMLREENDLDIELGKSLYDTIPGLEEKNLHVVIQHERSEGRSTVALEKRLKELEEMKR